MIRVTYDPGSPGGDETVLHFYSEDQCVGVLVGEAAIYVYNRLRQLEAPQPKYSMAAGRIDYGAGGQPSEDVVKLLDKIAEEVVGIKERTRAGFVDPSRFRDVFDLILSVKAAIAAMNMGESTVQVGSTPTSPTNDSSTEVNKTSENLLNETASKEKEEKFTSTLNQEAFSKAREVLYGECGAEWDDDSLENAIMAYLTALPVSSEISDKSAVKHNIELVRHALKVATVKADNTTTVEQTLNPAFRALQIIEYALLEALKREVVDDWQPKEELRRYGTDIVRSKLLHNQVFLQAKNGDVYRVWLGLDGLPTIECTEYNAVLPKTEIEGQ